METYAVKWREPSGETFVGRLALGTSSLDFDGSSVDGPAIERRFGYAELGELRIGYRRTDRLDGRPSLVIDRPDGTYRVTGAVSQVGVVPELIERLSGLVPRLGLGV
jgi:hypothetical protein